MIAPRRLANRPRIHAVSLLLLCTLVSGCATTHWLGVARRAVREPGQRLLDLPEPVAQKYGCGKRKLPHFELEQNEINPNRIHPGGQINHRIVYALCPRRPTEVVTGTLVTRVRFKGRIVLRDRIPDFELKPGRWSVDAFLRLPESAESGVYALEIHFERDHIRFDESLTFGVDS